MIARLSLLLVSVATLTCGGKATRDEAPPSEPARLAPQPAPGPAPHSPSEPGPAPAPAVKYPVRSSRASALEIDTPGEARTRYALEEPDLFGELEGEGKQLRPANCVQWEDLHSRNYQPSSGVEETPDTGARLRCSTLKLIASAKPAERSYVREFSWNDDLLSLLPSDIATSLRKEDAQALDAARAAGTSFKAFDPKARIKPSTDKELLEIVEGNKQTMILMYPMAWGDFDGDGTDDMAMTVINGATRGRLTYSRLLVVTRSSANERLRVIASH